MKDGLNDLQSFGKNFLKVKKKILLYLDNQLADKKEFFNEIINCKKALKLFTEFVDAEDVLRNTSFEFAVKMATQTTEELPIKTILPLPYQI